MRSLPCFLSAITLTAFQSRVVTTPQKHQKPQPSDSQVASAQSAGNAGPTPSLSSRTVVNIDVRASDDQGRLLRGA